MRARPEERATALTALGSDRRVLREALGCFATGVTLITGRHPGSGALLGVTASSFNSVSLDPPLVLFSLGRHLRSFTGFLACDRYAVNVLAASQRELSDRFASATLTEKWSGVPHELSPGGCPILTAAVAAFDCRAWARHEGGDHVIFIAEVERLFARPAHHPLVFYRGDYRSLDTRPGEHAPELDFNFQIWG
ncbi:MAG: flavin reductase family protein [Alphaproteobacteria bacterium]|nr:flavin reductase family protein [Alphaproteobacteria bacterium]